MIKAVIFDMDGLMFDNERVAFKAYQTILKEQKLDMDEEFYKLFLGQSMENANRLMKERYGQDFDAYKVAKDVHIYLYDYFEKNGVPLKKGLIELLEYLRKNHYQTIVASSSSRDRLDKILGYSPMSLSLFLRNYMLMTLRV
ncbi:MAG: HAD family phosphatase, partial [Erysipelotrichaceae bacterium]|nr:HAD family phosphatase [Erysipelotrichaceae bacterium]